MKRQGDATMAKQIPVEASKRYVEDQFPTCIAAILGGSAVSGNINGTSDLDLVIIDPDADVCFQETVEFEGWNIDCFVFYEDIIIDFFAINADKGIPTLQKLCAEGLILKNVNGAADALKTEAKQSLARGPAAWDLDEMNDARYKITDLLLDFEQSEEDLEASFLCSRISWLATEFVLRTAEHWCGEGKWLARELKAYDSSLYDQLADAINRFATSRDKGPIIKWTDRILAPYGGRLFAGYYAEGDPDYSS